jgi:hypothetical protein
MGFVVGFAFVLFSFWALGRWDSPLYNGMYLSHEICNTKVCLGLAPASALT